MKPLVVGIGGTTRPGSASERALRAALDHAQARGCDVVMLGAGSLPTRIYDPASSQRCAEGRALVQALQRASGVLVSTPSYHGSISGLLKNALDHAADLASDERPYLDGRALGCIVVAGGTQALGSTVGALRSIAHALRAWPTPYAAAFDSAALGQREASDAIRCVADQVVEFCRMKAAVARREPLYPQCPNGRASPTPGPHARDVHEVPPRRARHT